MNRRIVGRPASSLGPAPARAGAGSLRSGTALAAAFLLLGGAVFAAESVAPTIYPDSPPPGFTGGFGEATCHSCHFDAELNQGPGAVALVGVPKVFAPGETYEIAVELTRPGLVIGGFQLTARAAESGAQAGDLAAVEREAERVGFTTSQDIVYAHHLLPGTERVATDTARWTLLWTAPEGGTGEVLFHVTANAADGDESIYGDVIFTSEVATVAQE